jgi:hypothetical protein
MNIDLEFDYEVLLKGFFEATEDYTKKDIKALRTEFEKGEFTHKWSHDLRWLKESLVDAAEKAADVSI